MAKGKTKEKTPVKNKRLEERRKKISPEVKARVKKAFDQIDSKYETFAKIIVEISDNGLSLRKALLKYHFSSATFYELIDEDSALLKQYARACEERADLIADEIIDIADKQDSDIIEDEEGKQFVNHNVINRSRLQVDSRKWLLAKLNPKKYGDKLDVNAGIKIEGEVQIDFDID